ncbi:hypothetical protein Q7P37_000836 [Cladosporium fusiforme]
MLSLDPLLHHFRLKSSHERVARLLARRPALHVLQPPVSGIYLTRTHFAARRLHWSLVSIRLSRSLQRRPELSALVSANILPQECGKVDRRSGEFVWGAGVAGPLVERKRRLERERLKEGLRARVQRKADEILRRRKEGVGVGVLVWRFSKRLRLGGGSERRETINTCRDERPKREKVSSLRRFWESLDGSGAGVART